MSLFFLKASSASDIILFAAVLAPFLALLTSLIQGGFWVIATLFELALGALIARFVFPMSLINLVGIISPIIIIVIFGALWGFWWI